MRRALFFLLAAAVAFAQQQRSFIACPIVRDTKTVPCFLAEYEGETYFLGIQQDITSAFHPPQLKHEVLVEGTVADGPRVCGGIPLKPVAISVMKEVNLNCNSLLPAEPGIEAPAAARGAGPSSRRPEESPRETYSGSHEFTILFQFNDDTADFAAIGVVNDAAAYAKRINAASVKISGFRAATLLSDGNRLMEKAGLAQNRATSIKTLFEGLGVKRINVEWKDDAETSDGKTDASRRRVTILVTP